MRRIKVFFNTKQGYLCKLALCLLLIWFLFPRNFNWLIPYRGVYCDREYPIADQTVIASFTFSADPDPYFALFGGNGRLCFPGRPAHPASLCVPAG